MWVCVCTCSVAQSCPTQDPMVYSPPGSSVHGILPLRILECVAISSSGEIFPTQGSNSCFLHWQANSLPRSPWEARRCQCIQLINGAVEFTYFTFYKENIFMYFMSYSCKVPAQANKNNKCRFWKALMSRVECLSGATLWSLTHGLPVLPVQMGVWQRWRPNATRVPLLGPGPGEKVPRGGLGLSLRTAPEYELLGWMAKVQPSLFICDHGKSHDIYAHTLGLFIGLSNWRCTSHLPCTLDGTLSMPAHRIEGTYLREGRHHRQNHISSLLLGNCHWMCNLSLKYFTCYYSSFPNGHELQEISSSTGNHINQTLSSK